MVRDRVAILGDILRCPGVTVSIVWDMLLKETTALTAIMGALCLIGTVASLGHRDSTVINIHRDITEHPIIRINIAGDPVTDMAPMIARRHGAAIPTVTAAKTRVAALLAFMIVFMEIITPIRSVVLGMDLIIIELVHKAHTTFRVLV